MVLHAGPTFSTPVAGVYFNFTDLIEEAELNAISYSMLRLQHFILHPRTALTRLIEGRERFADAPWSVIESLLRPGSVVLEAGAADGTDTIKLASLHRGEIKVIALEPVPIAFEQLIAKTSHLSNVKAIQCALASYSGLGKMWESRGDGSTDSSSLLSPELHARYFSDVEFRNQIQVQCITLDSLLAKLCQSQLDLMWLDMQGVELEVLRASPIAREGANAIYMEVSRKRLYSGASTYRDVVQQMRQWGFKVAIDRVGAISGNMLFIR